jgi:hypothetical protein
MSNLNSTTNLNSNFAYNFFINNHVPINSGIIYIYIYIYIYDAVTEHVTQPTARPRLPFTRLVENICRVNYGDRHAGSWKISAAVVVGWGPQWRGTTSDYYRRSGFMHESSQFLFNKNDITHV